MPDRPRPTVITDNLMLEPQLQYTWQGLSLDDGQDNAGYVKFGHGSTQHVRAGFRLGSHNDMTFGEGTSSRDTLRDSAKHRVRELPVNWWVQPSVIRTFSSRGDMSMGTAAAGSNMTFSPSRNGTSLDLQAGLEARVRENITLGVQAEAGTPVVVGGGDVQLGCLGLGVVRPAQTAVLGGTFWQQVVNLPTPIVDPEMNVRVNPHVISGMVQTESISFFTGLTMRWFRDAFCAEEKLIAERLGVDAYTLLEEMASRVPAGAWGVMPIFSDRMRFKSWYHAAPSFINLSIDPEKCNKATLFRALEENAAIVSTCNLQQIADFTGIHPTSLVFAGGGSKGKLWSQILADVSGLTVNVPVVKEATALGRQVQLAAEL